MNQFKAKKGLPGVIGAIDGCHIPMKAPRENENEYINRKRFHQSNYKHHRLMWLPWKGSPCEGISRFPTLSSSNRERGRVFSRQLSHSW